MMVLHAATHCCISSNGTTTGRLSVHRLFYEFREHTCRRYYTVIILGVLLRYCLDLVGDVITIIFAMIGEVSSSAISHCSRFKIRHVGGDTSMTTC